MSDLSYLYLFRIIEKKHSLLKSKSLKLIIVNVFILGGCILFLNTDIVYVSKIKVTHLNYKQSIVLNNNNNYGFGAVYYTMYLTNTTV